MNTKSATSTLRKAAMILVAFAGAWSAPALQASTADALQTLDQVEVFSASKLQRIKYDPIRFIGLDSQRTTQFRACQVSNINGLFCLDGQVVRNWPKMTEVPVATAPSVPGVSIFDCTSLPNIDTTSPGPCRAMTADVEGNIYVAVKRPGTGSVFSLVKVYRSDAGSCGTGAAIGSGYCWVEQRSLRPEIADLSPVEGEFAADFFGGNGLLAVEAGAKVVFYPFDVSVAPIEYDLWSLATGERIQSASILQREVSSGGSVPDLYTFGFIATSSGRVLWRNLAGSAPAAMYVHANSDSDPVRIPRGPICVTGFTNPNAYRIRASETTGRVFVTNRNFCTATVLTPQYVTIVNGEDRIGNIDGYDPTELDATLLTGASNPPDGMSLVPGTTVNLAVGCNTLAGCDPLGDGNDDNIYPAVRISGVTLGSAASSLVLYVVEGLWDCRYLNPAELPSNHPCVEKREEILVDNPNDPDGLQERKFLNVTPMLPKNVTDLFDSSGAKPLGLPPLLLSPDYRGQQSQGYQFEALFGVTDPNIRFRKTFTIQFDIGDPNLAGFNLGCGVHQTADDLVTPAPKPFNQWDIVTMVSERFSSIGGPNGYVLNGQPVGAIAEHADMLINKGCFNPTPSAGTRFSLYAYNLELAPDLTGRDPSTGELKYSMAIPYFANMLRSLYGDLRQAQNRLACVSVDAAGNTTTPVALPPLNSKTCSTLDADWVNGYDKLDKCLKAALDPKVSAIKEACKAWDTQFGAYKSRIEKLTNFGEDPANRVGELWSRSDVIKHVYYDHFRKAYDLCRASPNTTTGCIAQPVVP